MPHATFSIGVLCYGNFPVLAENCLSSILRTCNRPELVKDIRIGINACSPETTRVIEDVGRQFDRRIPVYTYTPGPEMPVYKYPLLRCMLHSTFPVRSSHFMWFDDDSYVYPDASQDWLVDFSKKMENYDYAGYPYGSPRWRPGQIEAFQKQPWYTGKPIAAARSRFYQGGWWTVRTALVQKVDYPFRELKHNGGDTLLGVVSNQQGWRELAISEQIGPVKSNSSLRRGTTTEWPWQNPETDYSHHQFKMTVRRLNETAQTQTGVDR